MSKADEMFERLGYEIIINDNITLNYEKTGVYMDREIVFELLDKSIFVGYGNEECCLITIQELQAINEKVKELGWNE